MTSSNNETPQSVVFVDSQITDYQAIVAAIDPGVEVIVYDGTQDGLAQIAQDLQGVYDLASVDIISHGAAGEVQVGTDVLTTSTIPTYAADLAAIGNALAPNGQLDLYGCDVAAGGDGFLTALQQATGRNVAASTDPIGATALGGTWTLDATTGPTPDALPANSAALQSFDGLLLSTPAQIYFDTWNGNGGGVIGQGNMVEQVTASGSTLVSSNTIINDGSVINPNGPDSDPYPALTDTTGFVVDTALNEYFIASYNAVNYTWTIQEGSLSGGGLTTLYTDPFPSLTSNNAPGGAPITGGTAVVLGGLALDAANGELYFTQSAENYDTGATVAADTGIYKVSVTGGAATLVTSTTAGLTNPLYLTLDTAANLVFFDDAIVAYPASPGYPAFPAVQNLDVANLTTGAVTVLESFDTIDPDNFNLQGLAIDAANSTLYLTAVDYHTSSDNAIYSIPFSISGSGSTATASIGATTTLYSGAGAFQPTDIVVDAQAGIFYTSGTSPYTSPPNVDDQSGNEAGVFKGSLTGGLTLNEVFAVSSVLPTPTQATGDAILDTYSPQLFLADIAPVVTAGATATFDGGGSAVTLDSGLTVEAGSSATLASATVTLSSGELSSDILSFNGGTNTETFLDGDEITATYSAGVLTLSGTAEVADYQTALDQVQFSTTSHADPTNGGSDTSRTISWVANDGTSNSTAVTSALDTVHVAPTVTAGASVNDASSGSAVVLDSALTVTDVDSGGNLTGAKVSIVSPLTGDTLSFTAQNNITESSYTNGVLTLTGTATVAQYKAALASITFGTTSTTAGDRTIDWQVSDGNSSNGSSAIATSTVDVVVPPTIGSTGNTATFYQSQDSTGTTLDGALTVTDGNGVDITSASVTIGSPLSGDELVIPSADLTGNTITGTSITVSDNDSATLTLSGSDSVGHYQLALRDITYDFSGDPTEQGADPTRTITWSVTDADGLSNAAVSPTTLDVYMTPVLVGTATPTVTSTSGAVTADANLTVTDGNTFGTTPVATVTISNGAQTGDELIMPLGPEDGITESGSGGASLTLTGTSSTTAADFQTFLDAVEFDATSPHSGARTLTWSFNDDAGGKTNDSNFFMTDVDVVFGPQLTAGATATFDGGSATPVTLDGGLTVTDAQSTTLSSAAVSIGAGFIAGDTLTINGSTSGSIDDGASGTITYSFSGSTLSLTGTDTVTDYQSALELVQYNFTPTNGDPTSGGGDLSRTISWTASDSTSTSSPATSTLDVVHVAPTVTAGGTVTFTGGSGTRVTLDGTVAVADVDSAGNLAGATVSIGSFLNGDTLNFATQNGITGAYDAATGVLTLAGTASLTNYQTALDSITYSFSPSDGDPTSKGNDTARTISWTVTDGSTSNGTSNAGTSTLDTVHVAPTLLSGGTVTFTGGGSAVTLDSTLTVSDVDSGANLAGATVSVSSGYLSGDTLNFANQAGITGSYDAVQGILTLTGTATIAQYQAALESVTYSVSPSDGDPTGGGSDTARTISWTVTDGSTSNGSSNTGTSTLDTVHVAPTVTAGGTATFDGGGSPVTLDPTLTVSDVDSAGNLTGATVSIGSFLSGDLLTFTNQSGITGFYDSATGVLTLSGTSSIANYDTALESITYSFSPNNGDPTNGETDTARTISWTVTDGSTSDGTSNTATSALDTAHVPPTVTAGGTATFDGGGTPVTLDGTLTVSDPDSGGNLSIAVVTISSGFISGDTLNFTNQNGITGTYDSAHGILTLTGTSSVSNYQTALDSITYSFSPSNGDPTSGGGDTSRTISWTADDGTSSDTAGSTLDIVHVAPTVTAGAAATFDGGGSPVTLDGTATVSDVDSDGNLTGATVSISNGFLNGDTLNFTNKNGITGTYDSVHGILTLTGTSSVANYQTALDSITYSFSPSNGDPTNAGLDTSRTISWTVTDGSTSNGTSNTATSTLDTVHVAPVVTAGATATFEISGPAVAADGALTVIDPDSAGNLDGATVTIGNGFLFGDALNLTNQNGITGTFDTATGVLTLNGTATVADYQTALDSVTFSSTVGSAGTRTLDWTVTDASTSNGTSNTSTSTVDLVLGPQITAGATATFNGGGSPVTLDGTLTVADSAQADLTGATVSISSSFFSGDTLNFTNQNGITGSYDAVHGILTLTGTSSVANYQTALDSITYSFSPSNGDPTNGGSDATRTISWAASDSVGTSAAVTSTLDTVHVAPVVTAGGTVTFEISGTAVTADGALTVVDPDSSGDLSGATVSISSNFQSGKDVLDFTNQNGITGSYDGVTGVLTLTGTATLTDYQTALDSITFSSITASSGTRTLSWTVTDGSTSNGISNTGTSTVDLVVGPQLTAGATATFDGGGSPVTLDGTLTVTDAVHTDLDSATVSITSGFTAGDILDFTNQNGITGSYDAVHGILTLTGTSSVANYQSALDSITYSYSPSNGDPTSGGGDTSRTISWSANDGVANSNTATSTLSLLHEAPAVTAGGVVTFDGTGPVALDTGASVSDVDSSGNLTSATVSITSGFLSGDTLNFINQNGITGSYDAVHGILTLTGTSNLANYQAALDSITYGFSPSGGDATAGGADTSRTISWQVNDGSTSNGVSNTATSALSVPTTPVVSAVASSVNASASETFTPAQLFSASDAASLPILSYEVEDESGGSSQGFWVLDGAVLPNGQITTLTAAQLSQLSFVAGSANSPVSDTLEVAASDAAGLGAFTSFTVTAAAHAPTTPPTVTAANELQAPNLALAGSSLFSGTAFGGNTITSYEVEDTTTDSGHWVFNGVVEPTNQIIDVTVAQLAQLSFDTGYGSDNLMVRANDGTQWGSFTSFTVTPPPNAAPPAGTADTLVMLRNADGAFEFYDIGHNTILLDGPLGQINPALQVAGVGGFNGADTADLLMRDPTTGVFTLYDVSNNNITGNVVVGQVGLEWTVSGLGDFSTRANETDMLMRNSNTGQFEVYDIANNAITFAGPMGQVGLEWSIAGFGDFSTRANETDMLMRNSNTGAFEVFDISNNNITSAGPMGQVGLEWSIAGFGDFSTRANETDMLMRNSNTGAFEVYDIVNNAITFAGPMGQVGLEWTIAGFGDFSGNANETDMLMRNSNTGVFELFDINNNTIAPMTTPFGQVGLEWSISGVSATPASAPPTTQLSGIAADPAGAAPSSATAQLTQAMASFAPSAGAPAAPSLLNQEIAPPPVISAALLTTNHA